MAAGPTRTGVPSCQMMPSPHSPPPRLRHLVLPHETQPRRCASVSITVLHSQPSGTTYSHARGYPARFDLGERGGAPQNAPDGLGALTCTVLIRPAPVYGQTTSIAP
jgi:hypothetical protein